MADTITLTDEDGNDYAFGVHAIGTNYKALGGVYCFAGITNGAWNIAYIGETDSLKRRLTDDLNAHHRYQCATRNGATHFFTRLVSDAEERLRVEASLRRRYDPPCNRQ